MSAHLSQYRDHEITVIIAVTGEADNSVICGICGLVMDEVKECPRCKETDARIAKAIRAKREKSAAMFREVDEILRGEDE
ncbi:MAG: hypothetical protein GY832_31095 [Chloroflexi bacterium]|nr:hypothetical protein [Chloroflexota bacterium]